MTGNKQKRPKDPLAKIKARAYRISQHPGNFDDGNLEDLVRYAKFYIADARNLPLFDARIEAYTDEECLIEYYAILFSKDESFRKDYEALQQARESGDEEYDDFADWAEAQIESTKSERTERLAKEGTKVVDDPEDDGFEFTPKGLGD